MKPLTTPVVSLEELEAAYKAYISAPGAKVLRKGELRFAYDYLASKTCVDLPSEEKMRSIFQKSFLGKDAAKFALDGANWYRSLIMAVPVKKVRDEAQELLDAERALTDKLAEALRDCELNIGLILDGGTQHRWRKKVEKALAEYEAARGAG